LSPCSPQDGKSSRRRRSPCAPAGPVRGWCDERPADGYVVPFGPYSSRLGRETGAHRRALDVSARGKPLEHLRPLAEARADERHRRMHVVSKPMSGQHVGSAGSTATAALETPSVHGVVVHKSSSTFRRLQRPARPSTGTFNVHRRIDEVLCQRPSGDDRRRLVVGGAVVGNGLCLALDEEPRVQTAAAPPDRRDVARFVERTVGVARSIRSRFRSVSRFHSSRKFENRLDGKRWLNSAMPRSARVLLGGDPELLLTSSFTRQAVTVTSLRR